MHLTEGSLPYWLLVILAIAERSVAILTSMHAILKKRETQSVIGWVGLIWLSPFVGSALYFCFGINRIQRKGERIQKRMDHRFREALRKGRFLDNEISRQQLPFSGRLDAVVTHVTGKPLLGGNAVKVLVGGEQAYPEMLSAIDQAQKSVSLGSYIFDNDRAGQEFVAAFARARERGVEVRVLVDAVGARYSKPSILHPLEAAGIPAATFLPTIGPRLPTYANLRNHRKLMVVDGAIGFTGGMNIRASCRGDWPCDHHTHDIHFRFDGPVVSHLQEAFVTDWAFTTDEKLFNETWFAPPKRCGNVRARGIPDGPDSNFDAIRLSILGAITAAEKRVDVMTPYFLPDDSIINALNVASMRGVRVRILLPAENNIGPVQWASSDPLSHVLARGCEVYQTGPPFDHSKLMLVDDDWCLVGSSNWDPRSLRLNFEFNVECYDADLNFQLSEFVEKNCENARRMTLADLAARSFPIRLRDGLARLAIPYL
ncbi:phospholipase D-like domain-containing protein [Planctomicrobium sp. SH661]|uniref:phospholipase D-like domain-containing protein n=1 Tax=Planctomicrobium sp. SH661 TaxID=3448124 RepID=UPI003F5C8F82